MCMPALQTAKCQITTATVCSPIACALGMIVDTTLVPRKTRSALGTLKVSGIYHHSTAQHQPLTLASLLMISLLLHFSVYTL